MTNVNWKSAAITISVVAGLLTIWFLVEDNKKKRKIAELQKEIAENENLNNEIKRMLKNLINNNKDIDPKIANELGHIASLIEIKQETKAIATLAKIIENLLKELYKGDKDIKEKANLKGHKQPTFDDYLEHAKVKGIITTEDFHLLSVMKIIRNQEAHENDVKKEKSRVVASLIVGFGIILGLCKLVKQKKSAKIVMETVENETE